MREISFSLQEVEGLLGLSGLQLHHYLLCYAGLTSDVAFYKPTVLLFEAIYVYESSCVKYNIYSYHLLVLNVDMYYKYILIIKINLLRLM